MKIYKSDVYTAIALVLLIVCFAFPSVAFYKVPQKIAAGQTDEIPAYVYPLWNLYQKGRYVSPYTPKGAEGDLKKMIERKGEVGMMSFPVWYVALEAPNYPKAAFPEGIPVWFHVDGFSGDIHEMNTINHYVGMYPLEDGARIERALGPFLMLGICLLMILFMYWRKPWSWILMLPSALFPLGFFGFYAGWMYWFGHNMQEWGAFKIKAFMPTALGVGHVAHFTTKSFPATGFWVLVVIAVLSVLAILARRNELKSATQSADQVSSAALKSATQSDDQVSSATLKSSEPHSNESKNEGLQ